MPERVREGSAKAAVADDGQAPGTRDLTRRGRRAAREDRGGIPFQFPQSEIPVGGEKE
jgi:hypothetical protein